MSGCGSASKPAMPASIPGPQARGPGGQRASGTGRIAPRAGRAPTGAHGPRGPPACPSESRGGVGRVGGTVGPCRQHHDGVLAGGMPWMPPTHGPGVHARAGRQTTWRRWAEPKAGLCRAGPSEAARGGGVAGPTAPIAPPEARDRLRLGRRRRRRRRGRGRSATGGSGRRVARTAGAAAGPVRVRGASRPPPVPSRPVPAFCSPYAGIFAVPTRPPGPGGRLGGTGLPRATTRFAPRRPANGPRRALLADPAGAHRHSERAAGSDGGMGESGCWTRKDLLRASPRGPSRETRRRRSPSVM